MTGSYSVAAKPRVNLLNPRKKQPRPYLHSCNATCALLCHSIKVTWDSCKSGIEILYSALLCILLYIIHI